MLNVAEHLRTTALELTGSDFDQFGRSSFNRLYYSAYLRTRQTLRDIGSDYTMAHKSIPPHLRTRMKPFFKSRARSAAALTGNSQIQSLASRCHATCGEIADHLEALNALRKTADYNPEVLAELCQSDVSLGSRLALDAQKEAREVFRLCDDLENLWRRIGS